MNTVIFHFYSKTCFFRFWMFEISYCIRSKVHLRHNISTFPLGLYFLQLFIHRRKGIFVFCIILYRLQLFFIQFHTLSSNLIFSNFKRFLLLHFRRVLQTPMFCILLVFIIIRIIKQIINIIRIKTVNSVF